MTEIVVNKDLYLVWLKEKGRKEGAEALDCVHVVVSPTRSTVEVCEFVKRRLIESSSMFFIRNVSPENINITALKIAFIEKGEVEGAVLME